MAGCIARRFGQWEDNEGRVLIITPRSETTAAVSLVMDGSPLLKGLRIGAVRFLPRGVKKVDYAWRNYFDVWLPTLAPSRELLADYRATDISCEVFFRRYRREMTQTDARQTIELLAQLAWRTRIAVGCYCEDETRCHRSALMQLIRDAAGAG